jgi:DNA-binding MarR family transcriptional regulator
MEAKSRKAKDALIQEVGLEIRAQHNQVDEFDDAAAERMGINRTDLRCLDILGRHELLGEAMTAGRLADAAGLTTGAVTALLDRLARAGYVRRVNDPADRRRVIVELTPKAHRRSMEIWGPVAEDAGAMLDRFTVQELTLIRDFLRRGSEMNAEHLARVKGGKRPG